MNLDSIDFDKIEKLVLGNVKFLNYVLEEARKRNEILKEEMKTTYGKLIGLGTPFEELIHIARGVKQELDQYLKVTRDYLIQQMKRQEAVSKKSQRRKIKPTNRPT